MQLDVAVSVINYKTPDLTLQCVQSVLDDFEGLRGEVVIIDNLSDDGSVEQIEAWLAAQPEGTPVRFVKSPINSGFSGGNNQGFAAVDAAYYLVLNSDALLKRGFFKAILAAARANPEAGFVAPRIDYDEGGVQNSCFRFHSPQSEFMRALRIGVVARAMARYDVTLGPDPDPAKIEWASFACLLLSGEMIDQIGPMDEGYFLYFEDAEYCLRAQRAGWHVAYAPEARAVHFRGGSGPVKSLQKARAELPLYYYVSRSRFLYQAHGRMGLLAANLLWHLGRGLKHLTRLLGRKVEPMPAREGRHIWTNFTNPLARAHDPRPPA